MYYLSSLCKTDEKGNIFYDYYVWNHKWFFAHNNVYHHAVFKRTNSKKRDSKKEKNKRDGFE